MTLTELKAAVLQELGVLATGEEPVIGDATIVADRYAELYEMLLTEELVSWTSTDDIPDFVAKPITMMVAYLCCGSFGVSPQKKLELRKAGALNLAPNEGGPSDAERQLRRQLHKRPVSYPIRTVYY